MKPEAYEMSYPTPVTCPFCQQDDLIVLDGNEWPAFSYEDPDNNLSLTEVQCRGCARSFWI
jgi:hypothetical protein